MSKLGTRGLDFYTPKSTRQWVQISLGRHHDLGWDGTLQWNHSPKRELKLSAGHSSSSLGKKSFIYGGGVSYLSGFPGGTSGKESTCQCRRCGFNSWVRKIPWRKKWQPILVFLPGESHGQRRLAGYSPWDHKESDTIEPLSTHASYLLERRWENFWISKSVKWLGLSLVFSV